LTLTELQREVEERYHELVGSGVEVTPVLLQRAPRFVYVLGEVVNAGRYSLEGPTSAMQAVALAGGWKVGSNLREIVVFRRTDDWRLMATRLDLRGALLGERPCPADELWLRDSDIVVVPKSPILRFDEFIDLVFTRGIYGVIPLQYSVTRASVL
jgi:polysaccharide export outer membrane protein